MYLVFLTEARKSKLVGLNIIVTEFDQIIDLFLNSIFQCIYRNSYTFLQGQCTHTETAI